MSTRRNLYSGNISAMATTITHPDTREIMPLGAVYKYDQLNRITEMRGYANFDFTNNVWKTESFDGSMYFNNYSYDANGNLLSLQRKNQAGVMFDNFAYQYQKVGGKTVSNRLYHVNDDVNMTNIMSDDIDDQRVFTEEEIKTANNYGYDEIGNLKFDKIEGIDTIVWTAYGKVKKIVRMAGYFKTINGVDVYPSNLDFLYDAMGNRIAKIEKPRDANGEKSSADWKNTYYIRDAQGNPMATYSRSSQNQEASYKLTERPMYGSSRVGIDNYSLEFIGYTPPTNNLTSHILGLKQYELTNHLGNVLTTFSDKKIPIDNNGLIDHYVADITSVSDYYPFGSPMDGRTFGSEKYRFGFNTQEKVDEVYGKGNLNTALFWEYDTRLGRRWNLDPKPQINISDYAVMGNNPIANVDWLGDIFDVTKDKQSQRDVKGIAKKENQDYVKFTKLDDGNYRISLDFGDKTPEEVQKIITSDLGLLTINDWINAKDENGNELKFLYDSGDKDLGVKNERLNTFYNTPDDPLSNIDNWSKTPRMGFDGKGDRYEDPMNPPDGYDGYVRVGNGSFVGERVDKFKVSTWIFVPRSSVVFHEIRENYYRTVMKMPYKVSSNNSGAHPETIKEEKKHGNPWNNPFIEAIPNMKFIRLTY